MAEHKRFHFDAVIKDVKVGFVQNSLVVVDDGRFWMEEEEKEGEEEEEENRRIWTRGGL